MISSVLLDPTTITDLQKIKNDFIQIIENMHSPVDISNAFLNMQDYYTYATLYYQSAPSALKLINRLYEIVNYNIPVISQVMSTQITNCFTISEFFFNRNRNESTNQLTNLKMLSDYASTLPTTALHPNEHNDNGNENGLKRKLEDVNNTVCALETEERNPSKKLKLSD